MSNKIKLKKKKKSRFKQRARQKAPAVCVSVYSASDEAEKMQTNASCFSTQVMKFSRTL